MKLHSDLLRFGYSSQIISTPSFISSACGLSVLTTENALGGIWSRINRLGLNTLVGIYRDNGNIENRYESIYLR